MNEQVARNVVLVRAIENADAAHTVLTDDDRKYATRSARELAAWQASDSRMAMTQHHFLEQRAEQILKRLGERTPAFGAFVQRRPGMSGFWLALPILAFAAGALLDRIADPHRVDLLSAPLLLIIGWNLLVYLGLLVWALVPGRRKHKTGSPLLRRLSVGKAVAPRKLPGALADGVARYLADWAVMSEPLTRARLSRTVHLAAAMFALGAMASLYARGLLTEYLAGWESTFLDASQVHTLLSWLFMPAMTVFPFLQGYSLAEIESLRFGAGGRAGGGERWVHLYGATLLLLVVVPRLVLAVVAGARQPAQAPLSAGSRPAVFPQAGRQHRRRHPGPDARAALQLHPRRGARQGTVDPRRRRPGRAGAGPAAADRRLWRRAEGSAAGHGAGRGRRDRHHGPVQPGGHAGKGKPRRLPRLPGAPRAARNRRAARRIGLRRADRRAAGQRRPGGRAHRAVAPVLQLPWHAGPCRQPAPAREVPARTGRGPALPELR